VWCRSRIGRRKVKNALESRQNNVYLIHLPFKGPFNVTPKHVSGWGHYLTFSNFQDAINCANLLAKAEDVTMVYLEDEGIEGGNNEIWVWKTDNES
jgi:hypothetical protein